MVCVRVGVRVGEVGSSVLCLRVRVGGDGSSVCESGSESGRRWQ